MTRPAGRLAECQYCHDPIVFVRMIYTGAVLPCDPRPLDAQEHGNVIAAQTMRGALDGWVESAEHRFRPDLGYVRLRPHFASCPDYPRPAAKPPPPAPEPTLFDEEETQ